jgi:hypothetical protein
MLVPGKSAWNLSGLNGIGQKLGAFAERRALRREIDDWPYGPFVLQAQALQGFSGHPHHPS